MLLVKPLQDCQIRGFSTFPVNNWILDSNNTNNQSIFCDSGAKTYFKSEGTTAAPALDGFIFRNGQAGADLLNIDGSGIISCFSSFNVSGPVILSNSLNQYRIYLWGPNNYGVGITANTLMYASSNYHKFYNSVIMQIHLVLIV